MSHIPPSNPRLRSADEALVSLEIADFLAKTERERLRLFRSHLRATVCKVSPLLLELALMEGIAIGDAVALVYPPQDWPWRPLADFPPGLVRRSQQRKTWLGTPGRQEVARFRRTFANPGVVIREADDTRGRFAIRPTEGVLGFTAAIGPCLLSAFGRTAMLKLHEQVPETLILGMPGRRLCQIIDHPLFLSDEFMIRCVMPDLSDGMPVIHFRAPLISFELPCGDETQGLRR